MIFCPKNFSNKPEFTVSPRLQMAAGYLCCSCEPTGNIHRGLLRAFPLLAGSFCGTGALALSPSAVVAVGAADLAVRPGFLRFRLGAGSLGGGMHDHCGAERGGRQLPLSQSNTWLLAEIPARAPVRATACGLEFKASRLRPSFVRVGALRRK